MSVITVPYGFEARDYQKPLFNCLAMGKKRAISVWHRRAGKDKVFMAALASAAFQKVASYFYILPYYKQARKVIWEGMDSSGTPNLAVFPDQVIKHKNNQEMVLTLINGSLVYFLGSDNVDSIVGTNPYGIFFSEYSLHKPQVWDFLQPILEENGGFAMFNGTPRGKNHMYTMLKAAEANPDEWFSEVLTIEDTGVMTKEQVDKLIEQGLHPATAAQEFYCSFEAALVGAYYEDAMIKMSVEDRIKDFPIDEYNKVHVAWDLGMDDTMVLIFFQRVGNEFQIIDMYANNGHGLPHYVKVLQDKNYVYGEHYLPHDVKVRELATGKSRLTTLYELGLTDINIVPKQSIQDGIDEVRRVLGTTYIHKGNCDKLVEALKTYRKAWDPERQVYSNTPLHDWSSHYADAFRTLAMGTREDIDESKLTGTAVGTNYDPLNPTQVLEPPKPHSVYNPWGADGFGGYQIPGSDGMWNPLDHLTSDGYYD